MKRFHVSKNLFDIETNPIEQGSIDGVDGLDWENTTRVRTNGYITLPQGEYTINAISNAALKIYVFLYDMNNIYEQRIPASWGSVPITFTLTATKKIRFIFAYNDDSVINPSQTQDIMLNSGSLALPYEPYGNTWQTKSPPKYGTSTDTITTLPADVYADGNNATVGLVGNMEQSGTPSPTTPIQPQECGERTGNLFDKDNISKKPNAASYSVNGNTIIMEGNSATTYYYYNNIVLDAGTYSISFISDGTNCYFILGSQFDLTNAKIDNRSLVMSQGVANNLGVSYAGFLGTSKTTFTIYSDVPFILAIAPTLSNYTVSNLMLNTGSTALPYEPYGVKIPISSANTTTNVYLGEVQSTRKIGKYIFTGEENITRSASGNNTRMYYVLSEALASSALYCTHFEDNGQGSVYPPIGKCYLNAISNFIMGVDGTEFETADDFKAWLRTQYTNGNPLTVWYVLATPQTAVVNEPIRKIGDYADTVSGITIPTISGADSFDVQTTLKPSEVDLTYTGWHDASVKEWDGSEWQ